MKAAEKRALDAARHLIEHGVPVGIARPALDGDGNWAPDGGRGGTGYLIPPNWQKTTADPKVLDQWHPGDALFAVMGHGVDGLDLDPHKGGSLADVQPPRSYGRAITPSGGSHDLIASLGLRSRDGLMPGVDYKGGSDGAGHGFLFIAPTRKRSKVTGEVEAYRWVESPDLSDLLIADDHSGEALAGRVRETQQPRDEAPVYDGPEYAELPPEQRTQADQYVEARLFDLRASLAMATEWDEGERDHLGRGWESLARDAAWTVAKLAVTPWTGLSEEEAEATFAGVLPEVIASDPKCRGKWSDALLQKAAASDLSAPPWAARTDARPAHERFPLLDIVGLVDPNRPPRRWLWDDLIPEGDAVSIVAPAGEGKSLVVLALVIAALRGDAEFIGRSLTFAGRVLYVDMENSEDDWSERLVSLGVTSAEARELLGTRFFPLSMPRLRGLDTEQGAGELVEVIEAYGIRAGDLVVLDSNQRLTEGEENSNDTMRNLYNFTAAELKRRGLTVVRTDNTGWDKSRERGASNKRDDVAGALLLRPEGNTPGVFSLVASKRRSAGSKAALTFARETTPEGLLVFRSERASHSVDEVGAFVHDLLDRLRVPYNTGKNAVWKVVAAERDRVAGTTEEFPQGVTARVVERVRQKRAGVVADFSEGGQP